MPSNEITSRPATEADMPRIMELVAEQMKAEAKELLNQDWDSLMVEGVVKEYINDNEARVYIRGEKIFGVALG